MRITLDLEWKIILVTLDSGFFITQFFPPDLVQFFLKKTGFFDVFRLLSLSFSWMSRLFSQLPFSVGDPLRWFVRVEGAISLGLRHPKSTDASKGLSKSLIFWAALDPSRPSRAAAWKIPFRTPVPNLSIFYILPLWDRDFWAPAAVGGLWEVPGRLKS